jgi:cytochrome P450
MSVSETAATPVLAGPVPPEKQLPFLKFLRTAKENVIAAVPRFVYERPITLGKVGLGRVLVVCDPAAVKRVLLDNVANYPKAPMERRALGATLGEGLLVSDGEKWRSHRKLMAPSFDHKSIVSYAPGMVDCIETFLEGWERAGAGAVVDISEEMQKLTLRIISRAMFSTDSESICELMGATLKEVTDALEFRYRDAMPLIGAWNRAKRFRKMKKIFARLDQALYALIDERGAAPNEGSPDLLDRLVAARDAESGVRLSNEEVRDETMIIFVAGHETTAVAMTFTWYLLSQHPRDEAKLHAELDRVLGGRPPNFEDLANLPYTRMVIEEAMRLYPPAPGLSIRKPQGADVLVDQRVGKNDSVVVLPWVIHRHRELWDEPERFDPERFTPERSQGRARFAYLPFGGGPRICIGASLAMTEAQLILAAVAQRYRVRIVPGQDIRLQNRVTLRPKGGIKMVLVPRTQVRKLGVVAVP